MPTHAPDLQCAVDGHGPLLQRDYWAVLEGGAVTARDVAEVLASRFQECAPPGLVRFARRDGRRQPLRPGDELDVRIHRVGTFGVRVVHRDEQSLTVATLKGHPEAGRITFGAYPNPRGEVVVHIRSRARSGTSRRYLGFLAAGEPMQTLTWADFIRRLATLVGVVIRDVIHVETRVVEERPEDEAAGAGRPTYRATGG